VAISLPRLTREEQCEALGLAFEFVERQLAQMLQTLRGGWSFRLDGPPYLKISTEVDKQGHIKWAFDLSTFDWRLQFDLPDDQTALPGLLKEARSLLAELSDPNWISG
jgi:hypothetical protein